ICITGNQPHDVSLALIARASVLLRTTHFDGDAVSVRESLQLGTPVVATDTGMRPDGVHLMRALDIDSLVEGARIALSRPPSGEIGAEAADQLDAVLELYATLCAGLRRPPVAIAA
nr:hypothetical protein [Gemmatimonadaceae bacterium]